MNSIRTHAKINLSLDVTEKRKDGYHNIDSIFEEISLYDTITISKNDSHSVTVKCNVSDIPCNEHNIAYKAALAFFEETGIDHSGICISIEKNIPSQAGMGGGSTNAAGVLKLLNSIFNAGLSDQQLMDIGLKTGADTPFFIKGGLARVTGVGEKIKTLPSLPHHFIVVAKGKAGISTPQAYKEIDGLIDPPHQNTEFILSCISDGNITSLMKQCINTFELTEHPEDINIIKSIMYKHNTLGSLMTGSGSAVFGIFTDLDTAQQACNELKNLFPFAGLYTNITEIG